jgi:hypothetical protein
MAYTIASTDKPKANDTPRKPIYLPAITALPHPNRTNANVPINSAIYFLALSMFDPPYYTI